MQDVPVAVIGGGSTGCSVLYHLARAGLRGSTLLEMGNQVGGGQTSRSTALVRTHYSVETLARMAVYSYRFFKDFEKRLPGYGSGYLETGLIVGASGDSVKAMRKNIEMYHRLGIDSRMLGAEELKRIEPMLDPNAFEAAVYEPNAGYAEPSTTASSFASAATALGGRVVTDTTVTKVEKKMGVGGGYSLSTNNGTIECEKVVICTGVWSKLIFQTLHISIPIKVVRHPVAIFGRPEEYGGVRPVIFDFPRTAYYKPEGMGLLSVGSLDAELDTSSREVNPDGYDQSITYEETASFSESVSSVIPVMATKGVFERGYSGLYDNTPDQQPIIDELSDYGLPQVYCVVGLSGHGFKLAPEFGRIVASLVTGSDFRDYDVSVFRLKRFEQGRLLKGNYPVSTIG